MRLDHLLSKESGTRELERAWRCGTRGRQADRYCLILRALEGNSWKTLGKDGGVAQLGEHLPCTQGVRSSILLISTKRDKGKGSAELTNGLIAQVVRAHA